jgi:hypothetical protein
VCDGVRKDNENFFRGVFFICLGSHFPISYSVLCSIRIIFQMVNYSLSLRLLSGPAKLVGLSSLQMLKRQILSGSCYMRIVC